MAVFSDRLSFLLYTLQLLISAKRGMLFKCYNLDSKGRTYPQHGEIGIILREWNSAAGRLLHPTAAASDLSGPSATEHDEEH